MFSHVILGVNDLEKSKTFYDALLGALGMGAGVANTTTSGVKRYFYRSATGSFGITNPINGEAATHGNGSTIGFAMQSPSSATLFMQQASPTAAPRAKTHRAGAMARSAGCICAMCATRMATRFAACTDRRKWHKVA